VALEVLGDSGEQLEDMADGIDYQFLVRAHQASSAVRQLRRSLLEHVRLLYRIQMIYIHILHTPIQQTLQLCIHLLEAACRFLEGKALLIILTFYCISLYKGMDDFLADVT
jgi:hypothetical protein